MDTGLRGVTRFLVIYRNWSTSTGESFDWPLARIDLDGGQRRVRMGAGACPLRVDVDRKSPGRVGREREFGDCSRGNAFFDVIPVKMQDNGLIACQPQLHDIACIDADEPHSVWDAATLALDVECALPG